MMLLARVITHKFSTPTNNHFRNSSNTRNQAVIQDGRVGIQTKNAGYGGNGNRNAGRQNRNQAFNARNGNDERANERPPMLEKGNYIPRKSRFIRFLDNKLEEGDQMWRSIKKGPYKRPMIPNPNNNTKHILEPLFKMTKANEGESLESVYERLTMLVNIMDRNNVRLISVSINTKFLNYLQPEWSKYVTMVHHNQTRDVVSYNELYDSLIQFKPHVLASKAKKAAKNHDSLALLAHSNAFSSQSHANSSYSPQLYYVTHPSPADDYEDEYQGELQRDS
nr:hypothetical protein [Tanacetum cinerariifolium]